MSDEPTSTGRDPGYEILAQTWTQTRLSQQREDPMLLPDRVELHPDAFKAVATSAHLVDHGLYRPGTDLLMGIPLVVDSDLPQGSWRLVAPDDVTLGYGKVDLG